MRLASVLPDETLYSRLVRSLTLTGMTLKHFLIIFFGNPRVSMHPYLTSGLGKIADESDEPMHILLRE